MSEIDVIEGETCPACMKQTLNLMQEDVDVPFFGLTHVFSMKCSNCGYGMADVESEEDHGPVDITFEVESEQDLNARVIKSAAAQVEVVGMVTIESGPESDGYITNVEGLLNRFKGVLEDLLEDDDARVVKQAKDHLKTLERVIDGQERLTIKLADETGNSAIISEKD